MKTAVHPGSPFTTRLESTYTSGKVVQTNGATSLQIETTDYSAVRLEVSGTNSGLLAHWDRADNTGETFTLPLTKECVCHG